MAEHGSQLPTVKWIGPVISCRLLSRTRRASRFASALTFANYVTNYAVVAPVEVASGDRARHCRPADRQLNSHGTSSRGPNYACQQAGPRLLRHEIAEGKISNEAMHFLKRRVADRVWRILIADERR